jgi:hypothetical protein
MKLTYDGSLPTLLSNSTCAATSRYAAAANAACEYAASLQGHRPASAADQLTHLAGASAASAAADAGKTVVPEKLAIVFGTESVGCTVWRCRLPVSNPVLKAPMVSALEAMI